MTTIIYDPEKDDNLFLNRQMNVLVLDDEVNFTEEIEEFLQVHGFISFIANNVHKGRIILKNRGAQEAEAVGQAFEDALAEHRLIQSGVRLEHREDQLLLSQAGRALDVELLRQLDEIGHRLLLQFAQVHR